MGTSTSEFDAAFWPLFLAAQRILGDRHAAEDVAADAVARAHVHWRRIGHKPYREAWVVRVAVEMPVNLRLRSLAAAAAAVVAKAAPLRRAGPAA